MTGPIPAEDGKGASQVKDKMIRDNSFRGFPEDWSVFSSLSTLLTPSESRYGKENAEAIEGFWGCELLIVVKKAQSQEKVPFLCLMTKIWKLTSAIVAMALLKVELPQKPAKNLKISRAAPLFASAAPNEKAVKSA